MNVNVLEDLFQKKQEVKRILSEAKSFGWIDAKREEELLSKMESDVLTIGVIGQMKCGKSTFLNSFVFQDDVLPSATTPMTAALSLITYGETKKIVAEFYTLDEWEEQKMNASRSLEEVAGNALEESKIKAAKELVAKSTSLTQSELNSLLGTQKEDEFDQLVEYVGANGKYVSITKSVTLYYPEEYLKGVEIVDTPGFNDPIVSREERTKDFLRKADVAIMLLYAGRPFDATDREILTNNVRQCGVGKVIIGINKYDIPYETGETTDEIRDYVIKELKGAARACNDSTFTELLQDSIPIPLSAEMALLSQLPMSKISSNDAYNAAWNRTCDIFEISSQEQMKKASLQENLSNAISDLLESEKTQILLSKPLNAVKAAAYSKKESLDKNFRECKSLIDDLTMPDSEREEKKENLDKAKRRIQRKLASLGDELDYKLKVEIKKTARDLEEAVDTSCDRMRKILNEWGRFEKYENMTVRLDEVINTLITRKLKYIIGDLTTMMQRLVHTEVNNFTSDVSDVLRKNLPDFDRDDFISKIKNKLFIDIGDKELFVIGKSDEGDNKGGIGDTIYELLDGLTVGGLTLIDKLANYQDRKKFVGDTINDISSSFSPMEYLNSIMDGKEVLMKLLYEAMIGDFIVPLQEQLEEVENNLAKREMMLQEAQEKYEQLEKDKVLINQQIESVFASLRI